LPEIIAIDLGNPEKYNIKSLMERCADTGTILYSRIAEEPGERWKDYINRIGDMVTKTKARVILRPRVFPESKEECKEMQSIWHSLTS
jgi:hypothetical protein